MIDNRIQKALMAACEKESVTLDVVELSHPVELSHGDYATNIALVAAKQAGVSPKEFAEKIVAGLGQIEGVEKVEIAGPGFINFFLTRDFFAASIRNILSKQDSWGMGDALQGKKVMVEYTQPNPFKPFHIGHLMTNTIGESVACMVEAAGGEVMRVNYQGDVGLHVAKALWGLKQKNVPADDVEKIGEAYVYGNAQYEENETARAEIVAINKQVYARDLAILETYEIGKKVSLAHFEELYKILGTKFDHYFFESETAKLGKQLVEEGLEKNVFEKSDGAVVFHGEQYGLHTRVFITKDGLPTYETKDLGLALLKLETYPFDISITTTAVEQKEYFKVVWKALTLLRPEFEGKLLYVTHGMMQLASGKMSSRKGNVITGESLLHDVIEMAQEVVKGREFSEEEKNKIAEKVAVGAIKFSILKQSTGKNIVFDPKQSLSFEGDSGPYLQYSLARAYSVLEKAKKENVTASASVPTAQTSLVEKMLYQFPEVVARAVRQYEPHYIATYLTETASTFNAWYAQEKILDGTEHASYKLAIVQAFVMSMQKGLWLLGIPVLEKM